MPANAHRAADIVAIGDNPILAMYLSGLFQQFGWTVASMRSCADGVSFLRDNRAAVAICEETLPEGGWSDAAAAIGSLPDAPAMIVVGDDPAIVQEVASLGGFDALVRPLKESDVVWSVASAWHAWMNRREALGRAEFGLRPSGSVQHRGTVSPPSFRRGGGGGPRCSDA